MAFRLTEIKRMIMNKNFGLLHVTAASPVLHLGAPQKNVLEHIALIEKAAAEGSSLIVFPELSLSGSSLGKAFFQEKLLEGAEEALLSLTGISAHYKDIVIAAGAPVRDGGRIYNASFLLSGGRFIGAAVKRTQTRRGLRDGRIFASGVPAGKSLQLRGHEIPLGCSLFRIPFGHETVTAAVLIGEDAGCPQYFAEAAEEADFIITPAADARKAGSLRNRHEALKHLTRSCHSAVIYANAGCGESSSDEVFGGELIIAEDGAIIAEKGSAFQPKNRALDTWLDLSALRCRRRMAGTPCPAEARGTALSACSAPEAEGFGSKLPRPGLRPVAPYPFIPEAAEERDARLEEILSIQAAGLARRLRQLGSADMVIGVSGGLDSTAALLAAARALELLDETPDKIMAVTLPGFGTTDETYRNASELMAALKVKRKEISVIPASLQHFKDIGHDPEIHDVTYENTQARERTQILMDLANKYGGIVVGTGDLSELALGWCTYNGDHMSMYAVNSSVPKTLLRPLLAHEAERYTKADRKNIAAVLRRIAETPVSPELLPPDKDGKIAQKTEEIVGPYSLHDFFLYRLVRCGDTPDKILWLAEQAFGPEGTADETFTPAEIQHWLKFFLKRFFTQQFKRSCAPEGAAVGSIAFSPRQGFYFPSDADGSLWQENLS